MRLLFAYTKKYSYYKLRIIFLYLKLVGETKSMKKGVHNHYSNSSHARHATQNNINIFYLKVGVKYIRVIVLEYSK